MSEKKIKIKDELKTSFLSMKLSDKLDLSDNQFSASDMIEFADEISKKVLSELEKEFSTKKNNVVYSAYPSANTNHTVLMAIKRIKDGIESSCD